MTKRLLAVLAGFLVFGPALAGTDHGQYLGTFSGNDNAAEVAQALGIDADLVFLLAKVDWPATGNDGLSISNLVLNEDDEATSGEWSYDGLVDLIVIKAGPEFAIYLYDPAASMGGWDTSDVGDRGLSHISAYQLQAVPLPAAVWLMFSALFGLGLIRRRT